MFETLYIVRMFSAYNSTTKSSLAYPMTFMESKDISMIPFETVQVWLTGTWKKYDIFSLILSSKACSK